MRTFEMINKEYNEICGRLGFDLSQLRIKEKEFQKYQKEMFAKIDASYAQIDLLVEEHAALSSAASLPVEGETKSEVGEQSEA